MRLKIILCLVLLLPCAASGSWSEEPFPYSPDYVNPVGGVTLDQLLNLAEKNNASIQEAMASIHRAAALRTQAGLRANPEIQFSAGTSSIGGDSGESQWSASYQHSFELSGKRGNREKVADAAQRIAEAEAQNQKRQVFAEVSRLYAEVLAGAAMLESLEETVRVAAEVHRIAAARVAEGEAAAVEKGLAEVELNRLRSEVATIRGQILAAWSQLQITAGIYEPERKLKGDPIQAAAFASRRLEELMAFAKANRPDLKIAALKEELAMAELALARAEGVSDLQAFVEYSSEKSRFDQFGFNAEGSLVPIEDSDRIVTAGISVQLPLFNRNQGSIQAGQAGVESARVRNRSEARKVEIEVQLAYERYQLAMANYDNFQNSIIGAAGRQTDIIRAAYEAGELRLFDLLSQQRSLLEVRRSFIATAKEYSQAVSDLVAATGMDPREAK